MKNNKIIKFLFTGLLASVLLVSCNLPEDDAVYIPFEPVLVENPETVTQFIIFRDDLSILESAMRIMEEEGDVKLLSELNIPGGTTVFAPTNDAFQQFFTKNGIDEIEDLPYEDLESVVLNHIVTGKFLSSSLSSGYVSTRAFREDTDQNLSMYVEVSNGVVLNGESKVTTADVEANNGVLHIVDTVIGLPSNVTLIEQNPNFSSFLEALTRADTFVNEEGNSPELENLLRNLDRKLTLFIPNNAAFASLLSELGVASIQEIEPETLVAVLAMHIVNGKFINSEDLKLETVETLRGNTIDIDPDNLTLKDSRGRVANFDVDFLDIQSAGGVIHAIDKVLLNPEM